MIMEQIALNLLAKKKSYNEIFSEQYLKSLEDNSSNDISREKDEKEETKKDKIYIAKQQLDKIAEKNKYDTLNKINIKQQQITTEKKILIIMIITRIKNLKIKIIIFYLQIKKKSKPLQCNRQK